MSNSKEEIQAIIKDYIKKNLSVELWEINGMDQDFLEVVILLEDEEISRDYIEWCNP